MERTGICGMVERPTVGSGRIFLGASEMDGLLPGAVARISVLI